MGTAQAIATLFLLVSVSFCAQTYPGTSSRPILSENEAALLTKEKYLQGWLPETILTSKADYTVGIGEFIQAAVNAAINAGGTARKYIKITEGIHNEIVYIPNSTNVPITLFGAGNSSSSTVIRFNLSATSTASDYINQVGHLFKLGDPAYETYLNCSIKPTTIGTTCSSVVLAGAANVEIINLTIQNLSKENGTGQAVALYTQGDKAHISNCRLLSHQDTFWSGVVYSVTRGYVSKTYIEGDIDFVFGGGSTVFDGCVFHAKSDRRNNSAIIFAPATAPLNPYGFLVMRSVIKGDSSWLTSKTVYLARSWDNGVANSSVYVVGTSPNGQLTIRDSTIEPILRTEKTYQKSTSGRAYSGNLAVDRDLNNNNYNRFWEYNNTGIGA